MKHSHGADEPGSFHDSKPLARWLGIELDLVSSREKLLAGLGGFVSILALILISQQALHLSQASGLILSMAASSVLLFAIPQGPLSQPWPVIAGHTLSAAIGVACARWIDLPILAAAIAVGLSIVVMHQLKCVHPPGGATALTAVLGGDAIHHLGFGFVFLPVFTNAVCMVLLAFLFNLPFHWRRYPAFLRRQDREEPPVDPDTHQRVVQALRGMDAFVDVSEEDLIHLSRVIASRTPSHRND